MKYYLDTEFIEYPCTIDLISIGIVAEDGREFYAESTEYEERRANQWVRDNVIAKLWHKRPGKFEEFRANGGSGDLMHRDGIRIAVLDFIGFERKPEFWGYYADYDWVAFCWLFGTMLYLPKGWPMYCRDLKQLADSMGNVSIPKQGHNEHVAIEDARWNRFAHQFLIEHQNRQ